MKTESIFITIILPFFSDLKSHIRNAKILIISIRSIVKESNSLMHWALNVAPGARQFGLNIY